MAQKKFKQFFAKDFIGIDAETSAIDESVSDVSRAVNYEMAVGNSLRGRLGCQTAGGVNFFGIFPYNYTRTQDEYAIAYQAPTGAYPNQTASLSTVKTTANGESVNRLIGINYVGTWVLDELTIPVTRVSGTYPFTWYSYVNGSNINFCIKANGVSILDTSIGDTVFTHSNIYTLLGTIDALAELSVSRSTRGTCPPFATLNGAQTGTLIGGTSYQYGLHYQFTVNAGHTFYPGDILTYLETVSGIGLIAKGGPVVAVTATTIDFIGQGAASNLADGAVLGYMNQSAASFEIGPATSASSGNLSLVFPYWRLILGSGQMGFFYQGQGVTWGSRATSASYSAVRSFYSPANSVSSNGCLYIASSNAFPQSSYASANLAKLDAQQVTDTGLPTPTTFTVTAPGAGALTGAYRYKAFLRRIDAQGNIVEGTPSSATITYAAQYGQITVGLTAYGSTSFYQVRSAYKYTAESPAANAAFYIDDNSAAPGYNAFIQAGDVITLTDNTAQKVGLWHFAFGVDVLGTVHRTVCTQYDGATTPSSIRVADSSGYTIPNNSEISVGLTAVITRTAAGGNADYVLAEVPLTGYGNVSFFDNVTDAVLTAGEVFIDAEIGKEHDPAPRCSIVCEHQGGLVVARGLTTPNTVSFSSYEGIEYFPLASNSFDVPSTQAGFVTAIASDTDDRLAVFKNLGYYDVVGDLDGGTFSINVRNEADYGIASHASLVRVKDGLMGVCKNGFVFVSNGVLDGLVFDKLNARLINQEYRFDSAVAVNDSITRSYICSIPTSTTTPVIDSEPVSFVLDYSRRVLRTFERLYTNRVDQSGGFAVVGNDLYHLSSTAPAGVFKRLYRFNGDSPSGNGNGDSFIDNVSAISYILESSVINNGEPDILNTPIRARVWSIPNDFVVDGWVPFAALLEGGCSPLSANCGTGNNSTSSTITFAASSDLYKDVKLVSTKTHFYIIRFTTNTIRTSPFITGYEILYAESYNPEDLIK